MNGFRIPMENFPLKTNVLESLSHQNKALFFPYKNLAAVDVLGKQSILEHSKSSAKIWRVF